MDRKFKKDLRKLQKVYTQCVEAFPGHFFRLTWYSEEEVFVLSGNILTLGDSHEFDNFVDKIYDELFNKMYYQVTVGCGPIGNPQTEYDIVNYTPEELAESEASYERLHKTQPAREDTELEAIVNEINTREANNYETGETESQESTVQLA